MNQSLRNTAALERTGDLSRFDPVAVKIRSLPNLANGNYEAQIPHPSDTNERITKGDHNFNPDHRLTASLFFSKGSDAVGLPGNLPWVSCDSTWSQYNYTLSDTRSVSPNKFNKLRASYIRNFGGTAGRNILDGPGRKNFAMTLARSFRVAEKKSLQFRMEGTNFFNIVNLGNPGAISNSASN